MTLGVILHPDLDQINPPPPAMHPVGPPAPPFLDAKIMIVTGRNQTYAITS